MRRKFFYNIFLGIALFLAACTTGSTPDQTPTERQVEAEPIHVRVLAFNDFHGALQGPVSTVVVDGEAVDAGGVAYLAAHIEAESEGAEHVIVVAAGDLIGASPLISALFHDEPTIEALGLAGLEISSVGNHEFDDGVQELLRIAQGGCHAEQGCREGYEYEGAIFTYLAANVFYRDTGESILPPYEIREFGGVRVAFVGMTLEDTPSVVVPSAISSVRFEQEVATLSKLMPRLEEEEVDSVILLIHEGGHPTKEQESLDDCGDLDGPIVGIAEEIDPSVAVLVSAHTHQAYICEFGGKLVTSAMSKGRVLTVIDLEFDATSGEMLRRKARQKAITHDIEPKAEVVKLVEAYEGLAGPLAERPVGTITAGFSRGSRLGAGMSPMGRLIADAQLAATVTEAGAQIAFMNPGGIRAPLEFIGPDGAVMDCDEADCRGHFPPEAPVTFLQLHTVQPFGNLLVTMSLTGAQIHQLLESQWRESGQRHILAVSQGFSYIFDPEAPIGERVDPDSITLDNLPLQMHETYRVTVNNFLADGGDGFTILTEGVDRTAGIDDLDALVRYVQINSPLTPVMEHRIHELREAAAAE